MQQEISATESAAAPLHRSRSAERVLSLLDAVVTNGELSLTAAAARTDMPASTALRHLRVLTDRGYLVKDRSGSYSVGPAFVRTALASLQSGPYARLRSAAQPELEQLVEATEESAYLAVRDGDAAVYIATVESRRAIRHVGWVGRSVPIDGTAVGAALLAAPLARGARPAPVFNTGAIESDVTAVCAPVHGLEGPVAALSVLGPAERLVGTRLQTAADAVIEAAVATSGALSFVEASTA
ncbi:IclR family transcriptional regulator [Candidatus Poriferisodalis sp.]|uniref:IclR family transcriptional regulator n=1 Tax=Candidatus Poriferisodalis sp. TaxID=3101277 RepID=UPI003D11C5AC